MNYYRRYSGDYMRDTADLTLAEHGAYCLLLDYYYTDEKSLPTERRTLYRRLRALGNDEQRAIDSVLSRFFILEPDGYHQKRVDHEIGVSKKARLNGKHGGRPITGIETGTITGIDESGSDSEPENVTGSGHPPTTNLQPTSRQPPTTRKIPAPSKPDAKTLISLGVPEQTANDWLAVRKAKRVPLTDTALDDLKREAGKAGISVAEAVSICARRSWQGFKASWDWKEADGKKPSPEYDPNRMHI